MKTSPVDDWETSIHSPAVIPELDDPTFRLAVAQFDLAAEAMDLDANLRERLRVPQRSLTVSIPIEM